MMTRRVTVAEVLSDQGGWVGEIVTVIGMLAAHRIRGPYWLADTHVGDGEPSSSLGLKHDDLFGVFREHRVFPIVGGPWSYWYPAEVTGTIAHSADSEYARALGDLREIQITRLSSGTHRICFQHGAGEEGNHAV